ncbi:hypothetical protein ACWC6I_40430 [Streptomyces sp. NPDC001414]
MRAPWRTAAPGARRPPAGTPAECAAGAELLITMLPHPRVVEEVLLRGGAAETLPESAL